MKKTLFMMSIALLIIAIILIPTLVDNSTATFDPIVIIQNEVTSVQVLPRMELLAGVLTQTTWANNNIEIMKIQAYSSFDTFYMNKYCEHVLL